MTCKRQIYKLPINVARISKKADTISERSSHCTALRGTKREYTAASVTQVISDPPVISPSQDAKEVKQHASCHGYLPEGTDGSGSVDGGTLGCLRVKSGKGQLVSRAPGLLAGDTLLKFRALKLFVQTCYIYIQLLILFIN
jgi:hypothetical protein